LNVGDASVRPDAIAALGALAGDRGSDPCAPSGGGFGAYSNSTGSGEREVASVMTTCETRIAAVKIRSLIDALGKLATDPEPAARESVARALGNMGNPRARPVLQRLAKDTFDAGGQICSGPSGGPMVCRENKIVGIAAEQALAEIAETERARAELRARPQRGGRRP
jgi:HEAT repeat protein